MNRMKELKKFRTHFRDVAQYLLNRVGVTAEEYADYKSGE